MSGFDTVEALLIAVMERPEAERAAFLDEACRGRPELRAEVELLLSLEGRLGAGVSGPGETSGWEPSGDATAGTADAAGESGGGSTETAALMRSGFGDASGGGSCVVAGELIGGRYRLIEAIGEGGMGSVWRAEQVEPVRRFVAVKLIKAGMDSRAVLARFEAERQALAVMDHPNIAKVLDAGATVEGRPYFVMELVGGVPITDYCDEGRLTPKQRLELFVPVCQAIQHAHQKGVIHRDIKPSNVLVATYDGRAVPKVIDFGVAKATGGSLTGMSRHTGFGGVVGTPEYMSPEQASFEDVDVDTRSDVYSLGILMYELLAGNPPFRSDELRRAGVMEILRVVREEEPPRPSTKLSTAEGRPSIAANRGTDPAALATLLRSELDWVVMKALEKDRSRRYETANGLALDVLRFLAGEPVQAVPPSSGYRLKKFLRRHRGPVVAATLVVLTLLAGIAGTTYGLFRAEARRTEALGQRNRAVTAEGVAGERLIRAEAEQRRAESQTRIAVAVRRFLERDLLRQADASLQADAVRRLGDAFETKPDPTIRELLDRAAAELTPEKIGAKFPDQPETQASILATVGTSYLALGEFAKAIEFLRRASDTARGALGPDAAATLNPLFDLATAQLAAGDVAEGIRLFEQVRDARVRMLGPEDPETLKTLGSLAGAYRDAGRMSESIELLEGLRGPLVARLGVDDPDTLAALGHLAGAYLMTGRLREAIALDEQIRDARLRTLGPDHPNTLGTLNNLARAYSEVGRLADAIGMYEQVRDAMIRLHGADHPDVFTILNNLGWTHRMAGNHPEAIRLLEQVREARVTSLGVDHPFTLATLNNLAASYQAAGDVPKSIELFEQVAAGASSKLGPDHPNTLATLNNLGASYRKADRIEEALASFRRATEGMEARGFVDAGAAMTVENFADTLELSGALREAESWRRKWLSAAEARAGADRGANAPAMARLGANLSRQEKWAEAEPILREALALVEHTQPGAWTTAEVKSLLGEALMGLGRAAEAEPLLTAGYEGMKSGGPSMEEGRLAAAADRLIRLYESSGREEEAGRLRAERAK